MLNFILNYKIKKRKQEKILGNISYINWWNIPKEINSSLVWNPYWFSNFIEYHFGEINKRINFYSVFGRSYILKEKRPNEIKVFFTGENLNNHIKYDNIKETSEGIKFIEDRYKRYGNYKIIDDVDLAMGFIHLNNEKYIRFPGWIIQYFPFNGKYEDIKNVVENINKNRRNNKINKAVAIASHDLWGCRAKICDDIADEIDIVYAGKWRNNTNDLWNEYKNNKLEYLKNFKFNICAENMDAPQYVTEKLFESFLTGSIPIYHGALNNPEPDIIKRDSIIFWDYNNDNYYNFKLLKRLKNDDDFYYRFCSQDKISDYAAEFVYNKIQLLKKKISILLK